MQCTAGRRIRRDLVVAASLAFAVGCAQQAAGPSSAPAAFAVKAGSLVSDAAHSGGTPGFWFLQPMFTQVTTTGTFEPGLTPTVRIDRLDAGGNATGTVGTFTKTAGTAGDLVTVTPGAYQVNWHTKTAGVPDGTICRVHVTLPGGRELGFTDVALLANGSQAKNYSTNEYVALVDGQTLPIRFFVATGVVDQDADSVLDYLDNCPVDANASQLDSNGDGIGDACQCKAVICSAVDQCHDAGVCAATTGVCSDPNKTDGVACSDGNACTQSDTCLAGTCFGSIPVVCTAPDACHAAGTCNPATGTCSVPSSLIEPLMTVSIGPVGNHLEGMTFDGESVWVANSPGGFGGGDSVTKVRASDGVVLGTFDSGGAIPRGMTFDGANVWVVNAYGGTVTKLRASDGANLGTFPNGGSYSSYLAFDGENIWVSNYGEDRVTKLRVSDGSPVGVFDSGGVAPWGMVFDGENMWVANVWSANVTKLRASDGAALGTYAAGPYPHQLAFDGTNIWVTNYYSSSVTRLRASDGAFLGSLDSGGSNPFALAFDGANVWVANYGCNNVTKFRASDATVLESFPSGGEAPDVMTFDGTHMWIGHFYSHLLTQF